MTANNQLTLGWASRDITPPGPPIICGQFYPRPSKGIADPVTATALAIESTDPTGQKQQAVIVSCDLVYVPEKTLALIRQNLEDKLPDLDLNNILASATHTHTGPTLNEGFYQPHDPPILTPTECEAHVAKQVAEAIAEAWQNRKPGQIAHALGQAVVGRNRRPQYLSGLSQMYGDTTRDDFAALEGYEDHSLSLLFTFDPQQNLTGMIVNLACPSQCSEHEYTISADFWYETRNELRSRFGQDIFILGQCAAAGDQSPRPLYDKPLEIMMRSRKGNTERQEIAMRIADGVSQVYDTAKNNIETNIELQHHVETLNLPVRMVTDEEYQASKDMCANIPNDPDMDDKLKYNQVKRNEVVVQRYEQQKQNPTLPMELHVLKIGDVVMTTNPFELFLDFGLRIKARSNALHTFIIQLACGCHGYLPTQKAVDGKSYGAEVLSNKVGPEGGQVLVDRTVDIINSLYID